MEILKTAMMSTLQELKKKALEEYKKENPFDFVNHRDAIDDAVKDFCDNASMSMGLTSIEDYINDISEKIDEYKSELKPLQIIENNFNSVIATLKGEK